MRTKLSVMLAGAALLVAAVPVLAHHSFAAEFDAKKPVKLQGTVTKMEWINPHAWIYIDVKNTDGTVANWMVEAGAPNALLRRGWTKASLLPGTEIMVEGYQVVWGYSLLNLVSALGIICALQGLLPSRALETPALVRIGKVSYGIYVYHLPILLLGQWCFLRFGFHWTQVSRAIFFLVYLAVVLAVAEASFRWLEAPFLRLKDLWRRGAQPAAAELRRLPTLVHRRADVNE